MPGLDSFERHLLEELFRVSMEVDRLTTANADLERQLKQARDADPCARVQEVADGFTVLRN